MNDGFVPTGRCWVCGGADLTPVHRAIFELSEYRRQDPPLAAYSGETVDIVVCGACGFAQPAALPALPRFFDRMYDTRWSDAWIEEEHRAIYKAIKAGDPAADDQESSSNALGHAAR